MAGGHQVDRGVEAACGGRQVINETEARDWVCAVGRRMHERGYISGIDGNISIKLNKNRVLVTPSGVNKGWLHPSDLLVVDLEDGKPVKGRGIPTSEIRMHLTAYKLRPDIKAVVHAHPKTAVALTVMGVSLSQCLIAEDILQYGIVPTAPYATPGSPDLSKAIEKYIVEHDAVMLARHGSLTVGKDVFQAYNRLESLEHTAEITWRAMQMGTPKPLEDAEVEKLIDIAESLGVHTGWQTFTDQRPDLTPEEKMISDVLIRVLQKLGY